MVSGCKSAMAQERGLVEESILTDGSQEPEYEGTRVQPFRPQPQ